LKGSSFPIRNEKVQKKKKKERIVPAGRRRERFSEKEGKRVRRGNGAIPVRGQKIFAWGERAARR